MMDVETQIKGKEGGEGETRNRKRNRNRDEQK
jgi:hypothetical protein